MKTNRIGRPLCAIVLFSWGTTAIATDAELDRLMRLGTDAFHAGRFLDAERYHRLAFERAEAERASGAEIIHATEYLANDLLTLGQYMESERLFNLALSIMRTRNITDVPFEATVLDGLGTLYRRIGDYKRAESFLNQALRLLQQHVNPNDEQFSRVFNNLGVLYVLTDRKRLAEDSFKKAIAILENQDSPNDADFASVLTNLGALYAVRKKWSAATPILFRALAAAERSLGPDHPDISATVDTLGVVYYDRGQFAEAEAAFRRALQIRRDSFGPDHASLAIIYMNIGIVLARRNADEEAQGMFTEALRIQGINNKEADPDTVKILEHFAKLLHKMKRHIQAHEMEARASMIRTKLEYTIPVTQLDVLRNRYSSDSRW